MSTDSLRKFYRNFIIVAAFALISTPAFANYTTTINHADGTKTTIHSFWSTKSSIITQYDAKGEEVSEATVPGGAGKWEVHKAFFRQYMKSGSEVKSKSPTFSPIGSYD